MNTTFIPTYKWQTLFRTLLLISFLTVYYLVFTPFPARADWQPPFFPTLNAYSTHSVALGDVNGDGSLDIVIGNYVINEYSTGGINQSNLIYLNDGTGNFPNQIDLGVAGPTTSVALGDLNGDGMLDIVIGKENQPNEVHYNDGLGNFGETYVLGGVYATQSIALGDVNNDGAVDIVVGNYAEPSIVYLNSNHNLARFKQSHSISGSTNIRTISVALGDLDNDGDLDLIAGNGDTDTEEPAYVQPSVIYWNDSNGQFTNNTELPDTKATEDKATEDIQIADVNNDGRLDIIEVHLALTIVYTESVIYLNEGNRSFRVASIPGQGTKSAVGDINGDGALIYSLVMMDI